MQTFAFNELRTAKQFNLLKDACDRIREFWTAQKRKFSIKYFFSKCEQNPQETEKNFTEKIT